MQQRFVLHYVGYGYQRRGCPHALVTGATRWKDRRGARLITIFHELYALGPPWRSSFWLSPVQRRLARRLAEASDACITTAPPYAEILRGWVRPREIVEAAAFSTVGEPATVRPLAQRRKRLVVFGSAGVRQRAYREAGAFEEVRAALAIEEILDIGEPLLSSAMQRASVPVRKLGPLSPTDVGDLLADSVAGVVSYPPALLEKSTIFAAYCAHGLIPLWTWPVGAHRRQPATAPGWNARLPLPATQPAWQDIADAGRDWYWNHAVARQAETMLKILSECRGTA